MTAQWNTWRTTRSSRSPRLEPFCLLFRDLLPSKVLLKKADGIWTISGLACRNAWSFKETIAASPPFWLWGDSDELSHLSAQVQSKFTTAMDPNRKYMVKHRYNNAILKSKQDPQYFKTADLRGRELAAETGILNPSCRPRTRTATQPSRPLSKVSPITCSDPDKRRDIRRRPLTEEKRLHSTLHSRAD